MTKKNEQPQKNDFLRKYKDFQFMDRGPYLETGQNQIDIYALIDDQPGPESVFSIFYEYKDLADINKGIEKAKNWVDQLQRCRVCGCHQYNCKQCIDKTGEPCHWVEKDLCSACAPKPAVVAPESSSNETELEVEAPDERTMDFFRRLSEKGNLDLTIRILGSGDNLTVGFIPASFESLKIKPLHISGTAAELDAGFFQAIQPVMEAATGLKHNAGEIAEALKRAQEKPDVKPAATKASGTRKEKKKPAKPAVKKTPKPKPEKKEKKKAQKPEAKPPVEEIPKVEEPTLL